MMKNVLIFDTTLRDGAQAEDITYSVEDKWKIAEALDSLGVAYIEAGNPGSNPKDLEFFRQVGKHPLRRARLTAFGCTRKSDGSAAEDPQVQALLSTGTAAVAIFGKSWDFHVLEVIRTELEENLRMIRDTVAFFKENGREVIFDAEHFFDGFKHNPDYARRTLWAAAEGGADWLVLCDTNGGSFPDEVDRITREAARNFSLPLGIHCHDDGGLAVANSVLAVEAGVRQVQGTLLGFGERCGNANLSAVIPNLQIKRGYACLPEDGLARLTSTARYIAEVSNIPLSNRLPYVGKSAFAHKGGMHQDGVLKIAASFEHVPPEEVGNERRFLISEVAGRSAVLEKVRKIDPQLTKDSQAARSILEALKAMENEGYQFEAADSSFELMARRSLGKYKPFFTLEQYKIIGEQTASNGAAAAALLTVTVDGKREITAAEGEGPVNALDKALRQALEVFYPALREVRLTDFKVRVLNPEAATAARVRVLIESTDGRDIWTTVGVSTDIIQASWKALVDSLEYKLLNDIEKKYRVFCNGESSHAYDHDSKNPGPPRRP